MSDTIEVGNWANYFKSFSSKNFARRVKLEIFGELGALEEVRKLPLAGIYVELAGKNAPRVEILMGGISAKKIEYLTHTVSNVKTIRALRDRDNFDSAIEFESADGTKTLMFFEARTAETETA